MRSCFCKTMIKFTEKNMNYSSDITDFERDNINDLILKYNVITLAFVAFVIISGIIGNGFSFAFYGFVEKKTVTSFLITVLAVNDFFSSIIFIEQIFSIIFMLNFQSDITCSLSRFLRTICIGNSLILLGPVGLERCLKICVQNPRYHLTWKKAAILAMSLILFSVLRSLRQFFTNEINEIIVQIAENKTVVGKICTKTKDSALTPVLKAFGAIDSICFAVINIIIVVVYLIMIRKVTLVQRRVNAYPARVGFSGNHSSSLTKHSDIGLCKKAEIHRKEPNRIKENGSKSSTFRTNAEMLGRTNITKLDASIILEDIAESSTSNHIAERNDEFKTTYAFNDEKTYFRPDIIVNARGNNKDQSKHLDIRNESKANHICGFNTGNNDRPFGYKVEIKLNIMLIIIAFTSILSYLPYVVILNIAGPIELYKKYSLNALFQTAWRSPMLNSSINPYVIGLFNSKFRQYVKRVIRIRRN